MLKTVRGVARLPVLLVDAAQATSDAARQLPALQRVVTDRLGSIDRSVRQVLALLPTITADIEAVRETVEPQLQQVSAIEQTIARLDGRLADLQSTLAALKGDVEEAADHLPDPDAPGPLARARDILGGRS
jgi:methyl-accepting chemotaxis protein